MKKLIALVCAAIMALTLFSMPAMAAVISETDFTVFDFEDSGIQNTGDWASFRTYLRTTPIDGSLQAWSGSDAGAAAAPITGYLNSGSAMKVTHNAKTTSPDWLRTKQLGIDIAKYDVYTSLKLQIIKDDVVDAQGASAGKAQYAFGAEGTKVFYIYKGTFAKSNSEWGEKDAVPYTIGEWYDVLLKSDGTNAYAYVKDENGKLVFEYQVPRGTPSAYATSRFMYMTVLTPEYTGDEFAIDDLKFWAVPKGGDAATSPNYNVFATATASGVNITAHFDAVAVAKAAPKAIVAVFSADNTQLEDVKVVDLKTGINDAVTFSKDLTGKNIRVVAVDSLGKLLPVLGDKIEVAITQAAQ